MPWDYLLQLIQMRESLEDGTFTKFSSEVLIETCSPRSEDADASLLDRSGTDKGYPTCARGDAILVYHPSTMIRAGVSSALEDATASQRDELYFAHLCKRVGVSFILLALVWKLNHPAFNAAQAVFTLATMQRQLAAFGINDQVCFAVVGNLTEFRVLGCVQDDTGRIRVFLCDALDMKMVHHWWKFNFFLFNLEQWGRVDL
ncbi:hypothetical protein DACRYDRAFT_23464, partial [Dacryopinax primogenitus]